LAKVPGSLIPHPVDCSFFRRLQMASVVWKFFVRGDTSQWGTIVPPSDPGISIKDPKIDLASMKELVTKSELRQRVSLLPNKRCKVDQCFLLHTPELTSFLRVAEAIQRSMKNTALGSALLGAAIWLTRSVMTRGPLPYVRIVLLVSSLVGAAFAVLRYFQATSYIKEKQKELNQAGLDFAQERTAYYNKSLQEIATDLRPKKILHPLEGEAFFRQYFSEWAQPLLAQEPKTPEAKENWVESVLAERSPISKWTGRANVFLTDGCSEPSELMESLKTVFDEHNEFSVSFEHLHRSGCAIYQRDLLDIRNKFKEAVATGFPSINGAFVLFTEQQHINAKIVMGYLFLALDAALSNNTLFGKWFDKMSHDLQLLESPHPRAVFYEPVRLFLQAVATYVEKGTGEIPKAKDLLFSPPPMPTKDKLVLGLDSTFYERAKKLAPATGTRDEYLKFLEEVNTQESIKL
jgi:hypothetical protein